MKKIETHISDIQVGDVILRSDGKLWTVGRRDIKKCPFMGIGLFGDSYELGTKPVIRVELEWKRLSRWHPKNR